MLKYELNTFLRSAPGIVAMADKLSTALFVEGKSDLSSHITYKSLDRENTRHQGADFAVKALNVPIIVKLEYMKLITADQKIVSWQFSFFRQDSEEDMRMSTVLRFAYPDLIVLSDGRQFRIDRGLIESYEAIEIRDALNAALLAELVDTMKDWSLP